MVWYGKVGYVLCTVHCGKVCHAMSVVLVVCGIVNYGKVWFGVGGNDDGKRAPTPAWYSVTGSTLMGMIGCTLMGGG